MELYVADVLTVHFYINNHLFTQVLFCGLKIQCVLCFALSQEGTIPLVAQAQ